MKAHSFTPDTEAFRGEFERLQKLSERDKAIDGLLASVPEDEPGRDRLIQLLSEATAFDANYSIKATHPNIPNPKSGVRPVSIDFALAKKGFFADPKTINEFGVESINRAREIIMNYANQRRKEESEL